MTFKGKPKGMNTYVLYAESGQPDLLSNRFSGSNGPGNPSGLKGKRLLAEKSVRMTIWQKNIPTSHFLNLMA
jgi:hypothetical protein